MFNLLLSTFAMMGLTFMIGFFVAGVIKVIANWADFLDFYRVHKAEILDIRREHRSRGGLVEVAAVKAAKVCESKHEKLGHKINETINGLRTRKRVAI